MLQMFENVDTTNLYLIFINIIILHIILWLVIYVFKKN